MATQRFDLIVIGTGSAASAVAYPCRSAGWTVAVIDARPYGGTCALRGCDPKRVLVGAGELVDWTDRMQGKGVRSNGVGIDWAELMRFKRTFTEPVPRRREEGFAKVGIAAFHGRAQFVGPTAVQVEAEVLEGRYVVVAAGAQPMTLSIPGEEYLTTSEQFLDLDELPTRIIFVGGGYISFEFAHVAARAGAQVTILHRGRRPLVRFDPDLVERLVQRSRDVGVDVQLQTEVNGIERHSGRLSVRTARDGERETYEAELVVHGAGRVPEIDALDLAAAGVRYGTRGVEVNQYLQSVSNPVVYAAGDAAAGGLPLTPVAGYEGKVVAENLLNGNRRTTDYRAVPSVVFTIPPLAAIGLSEQEAREQDRRFRIHHENTADWYSSRRIGETCSGFKVLIEEGSQQILGAHLLGPHMDDVINLFALAIKHQLKVPDLAEMMYAYPTHGSDIEYMI
jgi:glutathione reductase (NADPH)